MGAQVSLLRFPRAGGPVKAYHPDSLGDPNWTSQTAVPAIHRVFGVDLDERIAWALDMRDSLVSVDLQSRSVRKSLGGASTGAVGPDGSLFLADARHHVRRVLRRSPIDFHDPLPAAPAALFGAVNDQLVAVTSGNQSRLITLNADEALHDTIIPSGDVAATFWGDLVAVAADSAVVLYETGGRRSVRSLPDRHHARRVAFSPSGHRLYVGNESDELTVYDRFNLKEITKVKLPARPRALRVDASGRWMLIRPPADDSVWVVDLATNKLAGSAPGSWTSDLPAVAGASTLVSRLGDDIASFNLRQTPPKQMAVLSGGGSDFWLATAWVPRERLSAAVAAAESATVLQDSALAADSVHIEAGDSSGVYLQVSTSQNPDWAAQLAKTLKDAGFPSRVLDPRGPDDGYRVVVGPYPSRDVAEENGRKLGRPFFILRESSPRP